MADPAEDPLGPVAAVDKHDVNANLCTGSVAGFEGTVDKDVRDI